MVRSVLPGTVQRSVRMSVESSAQARQQREQLTDHREGLASGCVAVVVHSEHLGAHGDREAVLGMRDLEGVEHDAGEVTLCLRRPIK